MEYSITVVPTREQKLTLEDISPCNRTLGDLALPAKLLEFFSANITDASLNGIDCNICNNI